MKRITFLAAAVLCTATAFAQINQTSLNARFTTSADVSAEADNSNITTTSTTTLEGSSATEASSAIEKSEARTALMGAAEAEPAPKQPREEKDQHPATPEKKEKDPKENHGQAVAEVAQGTQTVTQGDKVKEVATTKRKAKPAKVKAVGGASRAAGIVKPGTGTTQVGAARVNGKVKATGKAVRPATNARPVQVGGAVGVGTRIKVGKN